MSQSQIRLFEKWLDAGDDRTFGEWLAYRRQCVTQERQRRMLTGTLRCSVPLQQALLGVQLSHGLIRGPLHSAPRSALGGILGGLFG